MTKEILCSNMLKSTSLECFYQTLKEYTLALLDLPNGVREDRMRELVKFSVQMKLPNADPVFVEEKLAGTDCHQTSYIVSKKALVMMHIERVLGVKPDLSLLDGVDTVKDYAALLWHLRMEGTVHECV